MPKSICSIEINKYDITLRNLFLSASRALDKLWFMVIG